MKNKMVLAAVLLVTSLQVVVKAERLDDFLKRGNFKGVSRLDYNTLTEAEKDKIYALAFSGLPNDVHAARGVLNNRFKGLNWNDLERLKRDEGLDAVKAHFAELASGSKAPSASGQAVGDVQGKQSVWQSATKQEKSPGGLKMGEHGTTSSQAGAGLVLQGGKEAVTSKQNIESIVNVETGESLEPVVLQGSSNISPQPSAIEKKEAEKELSQEEINQFVKAAKFQLGRLNGLVSPEELEKVKTEYDQLLKDKGYRHAAAWLVDKVADLQQKMQESEFQINLD